MQICLLSLNSDPFKNGFINKCRIEKACVKPPNIRKLLVQPIFLEWDFFVKKIIWQVIDARFTLKINVTFKCNKE